MIGRNNLWFVMAGVMVVVASVRVGLAATQPSTTLNDGPARLQEVQQEFLNVFGNATMSIKNVADVIPVLYSQTGQYMGRLLLDGIMLGAAREDKWTLLATFCSQLQDRLSPELQEKLKDYREFFGGFELSTLLLIFEPILKEEKLGDGIPDMPQDQPIHVDQLMGMLQRIASKYGVDMNAFMKSMMGKGTNNARDLIIAALADFNVTSLLSQFFKTPLGNDVQRTETGTEPTIGRDKERKSKETLRFFRPLIATLLRENKIDLDADAVLQVLSPLLSTEVLSQAAPLLSTLGSQAAGDGFIPLLSSVLGGAEGQANREPMSGLISGLGALLGGGGNRNMDISAMITMASLLMNSGKTNVNEEKRKPSIPAKTKRPDVSSLADLAGKLAESNDVDVNVLLKAATSLLLQNTKGVPISKQLETSGVYESARKREQEKKSQKRPDDVTTSPNQPRRITDIIEPILLAMRTDKQGNKKIRDFILSSKDFMNKKLANVDGVIDDLQNLATMIGVPPGMIDFEFFSKVKWAKMFEGFLNKDRMRESFVQRMTPTISEVIAKLPSSSLREQLYEDAAMKIKGLLLPYGLHEVTLDTFPESVAPMVELMTSDWKLPVKPATLLVPLRDYVRELIAWVSAGLAYMSEQPTRKDLQSVVKGSMKKVCDRIAGVAAETRETKPPCLPLVICRLNTGLNPATLATAVTRGASLFFATQPALEDPDPSLLLKVVQAASGEVDNCEETFLNFVDCKHYYTAEHHLDNPHQEL